MKKIAINGFGRIGRIITRQYFQNPEFRKKFQIVAFNELKSTPDDLAFMLRHDSTHGRFPYEIKTDDEALTIDGQRIVVTRSADPAELPWSSLGVDIVLECTGRFTDKETAGAHLKAGAKKVIVSAPGKGVDKTIVMGVNHKSYDHAKDHIVSNASCTTNCLAPLAHVLHEKFGIEHGLMTTIHAYTTDQRLLDNSHKDRRRARSAAVNMIPTTTGAARSVGEVIPALKGKLDGYSVRVPTVDVSLTDLVATLSRPVTAEEVNNALREAANGPLKGILEMCDEPLVSSDFIGSTKSSIIDSALTNVIGGANKSGNMVKVCAWYDNEAGFSTRMLDLAALMCG